jgi:uncharacterized delta-60 repeat protein
LIVARGGRIGRTWLGAVLALAMALALAPSAAADSMLVQPDGKIVLTGRVSPSFAAMARLDPNGSLDPSFGQGGFVIDRRLPPLTALALQADGRIVGGGVGGYQLARYLPDGAPDPEFAAGGVGGTADPGQVGFLYSDYGPNAIVLRPDGTIVVGGTQEEGQWSSPQALVRTYDGNGSLLETIGRVPQLGGEATFESHLGGLVAQPDGSVIAAGSTYVFGNSERGSRMLLARFVPGSGTEYDPSFGGGAGLVRLPFVTKGSFSTVGRAIVASGGKLLVAGGTGGTLLLARFGLDGALDTSFGTGGFAAPPIVGPGVPASLSDDWGARSWAAGVAVLDDGGIVLGGGTSQWSQWAVAKSVGIHCTDCPQPLVARFDAEGHLDPRFGNGGVLHLVRPDGSTLLGAVEQVAALPGGKVLLKGSTGAESALEAPFVARLNADGSYDASFGDRGLSIVGFPCSGWDQAQLRGEGCTPAAQASLRIADRRRGRPTLVLRVRPSFDWAGVGSVELGLPGDLRPRPNFESRLRVVAVGDHGAKAKVRNYATQSGRPGGRLVFDHLGKARALRARFLPGSLQAVGGLRRFRQRDFRVTAQFVHGTQGEYAGRQTVLLRPH